MAQVIAFFVFTTVERLLNQALVGNRRRRWATVVCLYDRAKCEPKASAYKTTEERSYQRKSTTFLRKREENLVIN